MCFLLFLAVFTTSTHQFRRCILSESVEWPLFASLYCKSTFICVCRRRRWCCALVVGARLLCSCTLFHMQARILNCMRFPGSDGVRVPDPCTAVFHVQVEVAVVPMVKSGETPHDQSSWHRRLRECNGEHAASKKRQKKNGESIDVAWEYGNRIVSIPIARAFFRLPSAAVHSPCRIF